MARKASSQILLVFDDAPSLVGASLSFLTAEGETISTGNKCFGSERKEIYYLRRDKFLEIISNNSTNIEDISGKP
jgi:hypothetical protein